MSGKLDLERARLGYRKILAVCVLVLASISLLLAGAWYVRSWAAERRENVTYREIARSNAAELERRSRLLADSRAREKAFRVRAEARREAVERVVERVEYVEVEKDCEIPEDLWRLLEEGA